MFRRIIRVPIVVASLTALSLFATLEAQRVHSVAAECAISQGEEATDGRGVTCLQERVVRRHHVADDGSILFYLSNGHVYLSAVSGTCSGVTDQNLHRVPRRAGRLSAGEEIRVRDANGEIRALWPPCLLGMFYAISEVEVEALLNPEVQQSIRVAPVELPNDDDR